MADAQELIGKITITNAQLEANFTNIPQKYKHLQIVMIAASSANSNNIMRVNGDSSSLYTQIYAGGNGSTTTSGTIGTSTFMGTDSSAFTTTTVGDTNHIIDLFDYASSSKHKTMLFRCNRTGGHSEMMAGRWASNTPITSITLRPYTDWYTWSVGSEFSLYGIVG